MRFQLFTEFLKLFRKLIIFRFSCFWCLYYWEWRHFRQWSPLEWHHKMLQITLTHRWRDIASFFHRTSRHISSSSWYKKITINWERERTNEKGNESSTFWTFVHFVIKMSCTNRRTNIIEILLHLNKIWSGW